ncbi:MAG TPA: CDP-diacylglycerol--serine O-phosphatidyltransferase [Bryobacteraceae bacterium]|jgi:CDP-diacylglycerol--serine O-phosphatidyltransferase|nr:CDP-diacylglycerol--serine O-phosphatidyltransferase [Bryobacteraceae bacterium]
MGPQSPGKPPRRAAYALPTLFTSGNIFLGFVAIVQAFEGALQVTSGDYGSNPHFSLAAKALGWAVFFDGLDGRIARMTNTTSDFGRELDSLADVITFGIAPAVLAFVWGVLFVVGSGDLQGHLSRAGYLAAFFYLLCGAVRLARFNVQPSPPPKNPGRPDRKYFVGMPIPAGAGFVAAIVFMNDAPVRSYLVSILWLVALGLIGLLMVSTWRYPSFKQIAVSKPHTPLIVLLIGGVAFLIWEWPQPVLLAAASAYVASGIAIRIGGLVRRRKKSRSTAAVAEHQIG